MKQARKTQVVYVITTLELGGAQKICCALFDGVRQAGGVAKLVSGLEGPLVPSGHGAHDFIPLASLKRAIGVRAVYGEIKAFIALVWHLRQCKKKHPNLIVHTHSTKAGVLGRWAAFFAGISMRVHTIHGYAFHHHQSWVRWFFYYSIELVTSFITTHFVCVSSYDVQLGLKLFPRFVYKHSIIRAAVDTTKFVAAKKIQSVRCKEQVFMFGSIACFKEQKNIIELLQAFAYVYQHNPRVKLALIGDGHLRASFEAWIVAHGLQHAVILHGWQQNVVPYMQQWDAFVLSSLWEGLPCAIVEARLLQLPVLCYDTGGIRDVITNEVNGYLYRQRDWQGLGAGMLRLSTQSSWHAQLSKHRDVLEDFELPVMVAEHLQLYKTLQKNRW